MKTFVKAISALTAAALFAGTAFADVTIKVDVGDSPDGFISPIRPGSTKAEEKVTSKVVEGYLTYYQAGKSLKVTLLGGTVEQYNIASTVKVYNENGNSISASSLKANKSQAIRITVTTKNETSLVTEIRKLSTYNQGKERDTVKTRTITGTVNSYNTTARKITIYDAEGNRMSYELAPSAEIYDVNGKPTTLNKIQIKSTVQAYLVSRNGDIRITKLRVLTNNSQNGSKTEYYDWDNWDEWDSYDDWDDYDDYFDDHYDEWNSADDGFWGWTWGWSWTWGNSSDSSDWGTYDDNDGWSDWSSGYGTKDVSSYEGTIYTLDPYSKTIVITRADGKSKQFKIASNAKIYGSNGKSSNLVSLASGNIIKYTVTKLTNKNSTVEEITEIRVVAAKADDGWDKWASSIDTYSAEGTIVSVNTGKKQIVITRTDGKSKQFTVSSKAKVYGPDGKQASLSNLEAKDKIKYTVTKTTSRNSTTEEITEIRVTEDGNKQDDGWVNWDDWNSGSVTIQTSSGEGTIASVNASSRQIVITRSDGKSKQFAVSSKVKVYGPNGKQASLSNLEAKDKISYTVTKTTSRNSSTEEITEIRVTEAKQTSENNGWEDWSDWGTSTETISGEGTITSVNTGSLKLVITRSDGKSKQYTISSKAKIYGKNGQLASISSVKVNENISYIVTRTTSGGKTSEEITEIRIKETSGWEEWTETVERGKDQPSTAPVTNFNKESGKLRALNTKTKILTMELSNGKNVNYKLTDYTKVFDENGKQIPLTKLKMGAVVELRFIREDGKDNIYEIQLLGRNK